MSRIYFITGTDTGVGKTMIAAALLAGLHARGRHAIYHKPIQTGQPRGAEGDTEWIAHQTGLDGKYYIPPQYILPLPASPDLAARHAGASMSFESIVRNIQKQASDAEIFIVEGAGGLLVPVTPEKTMLDLIIALSAAPLVVTRPTLGTLNHTALTWRELLRTSCKPALLVVNHTQQYIDEFDQIVRSDNIQQLTRMIAPVPIADIAYRQQMTRQVFIETGKMILRAMGETHA
jgi:dethiobiotin synthetase